MRGGVIQSAFRVGAFGALGAVVAELVNHHAINSTSLAIFAAEVWAIAGLAWLLLAFLRPQR